MRGIEIQQQGPLRRSFRRNAPLAVTCAAVLVGFYGMGVHRGSAQRCIELEYFVEKADLLPGSAFVLLPKETTFEGGLSEAMLESRRLCPAGMVFWGCVPVGDRTAAVFVREEEGQ